MGIKGNAFQTSLLNHIFCSTPPVSSVDVVTSSSTVLWVAIHFADPGSSGSQSTNEISYSGYARVATERTASGTDLGGWVLDRDAETQGPGETAPSPSGIAYPMSPIIFPVCTTASTVTISNWSVGTSSSGGSNSSLVYSGDFAAFSPILVQGSAPTLTTGTAVRER